MYVRSDYPMNSLLLDLCAGHVVWPCPDLGESAMGFATGPVQLADALDFQIESGAVDRWLAVNPSPGLDRGRVARLARLLRGKPNEFQSLLTV
jgi:hypothetical protein